MSGSFQQRGPIHASMSTFEGGQTSRGSYGLGQGSYGSQQLQGEAIIVGFQGPNSSSQVRDFVLLMEIPIM